MLKKEKERNVKWKCSVPAIVRPRQGKENTELSRRTHRLCSGNRRLHPAERECWFIMYVRGDSAWNDYSSKSDETWMCYSLVQVNLCHHTLVASGWKLTHTGAADAPKCVCGDGGVLIGAWGAGLQADGEEEEGNCLPQHMQRLWKVLISDFHDQRWFSWSPVQLTLSWL